jgi:hypothetical protein
LSGRLGCRSGIDTEIAERNRDHRDYFCNHESPQAGAEAAVRSVRFPLVLQQRACQMTGFDPKPTRYVTPPGTVSARHPGRACRYISFPTLGRLHEMAVGADVTR